MSSKSNQIKSGKVKIAIPSLCSYGSDDEDEIEETPKLKNLNPSKNDSTKPASGLLSFLPPPKSSQNPFMNKKKPEAPINTTTTTITQKNVFITPDMFQNAKRVKYEHSEPAKTNLRGTDYEYEEDPEPFPEDKSDEPEVNPEPEQVVEPKIVTPAVFDQEALIKLCGSQGKRKGLDSIELLDVGVKDIVGDNKSELMKQITSEYRPPSNKDYFGSSSRKTHHVTYLAKVAVERDAELRNAWAQSKFNRNQAKQRYGF